MYMLFETIINARLNAIAYYFVPTLISAHYQITQLKLHILKIKQLYSNK